MRIFSLQFCESSPVLISKWNPLEQRLRSIREPRLRVWYISQPQCPDLVEVVLGMRIAMIGWELAPLFVGGMWIYCQALVRELSDLGVDTQFYLPVLKRSLKRAKRLPNAVPVPVAQSPSGYTPLS